MERTAGGVHTTSTRRPHHSGKACRRYALCEPEGGGVDTAAKVMWYLSTVKRYKIAPVDPFGSVDSDGLIADGDLATCC